MINAEIITDAREQKVKLILPELVRAYNESPRGREIGSINYNCLNIQTGDFVISLNVPITFEPLAYKQIMVAIIERKTPADLANSIYDERIVGQSLKMNQMSNTTGANIFYVIEGKKITNSRETNISGITGYALNSKLLHNMIRGNPFIYTKNPDDTAQLIVHLADSYMKLFKNGDIKFEKQILTPEAYTISKIKELYVSLNEESMLRSKLSDLLEQTKDIAGGVEIPAMPVSSEKMLKVRAKTERRTIMLDMYSKIPGVGDIMRGALQNAVDFIELMKNIDAGIINLQSSKPGGKKLSTKIETGIRAILVDKKLQTDILHCIPGVGAKSHEKLIASYSFNEIITGVAYAAETAKDKKSKILGKKILDGLKLILPPEEDQPLTC